MDGSRFDRVSKLFAERRLTRRQAVTRGGTAVAVGALSAAFGRRVRAQGAASPATTRRGDQAKDIVGIARTAMEQDDLKSVILRVTIDGEDVVTAAMGESRTGVPATTDMHFRNGAVAISYMSTLLLQLVDQKVIGLDDPIQKWLPDLPSADRVTLRMLANMTAGYTDYVADDQFLADILSNPFRQWTPQELMAIGLAKPLHFEPGTNWSYAHTNYVILGQALEKITGMPLADQMQENIFDPLGLTNTSNSTTAAIPEPVLHAFDSERRESLGIDPSTRFYEESTYWNPSWTLAEGAIQTTNIYDMAATAEAIGTGSLLTPESHRAQVDPDLLGFGPVLEGCPTCHTLDKNYSYGLGVVLSGPWLRQNPSFYGYSAHEAYLPSRKIAIALATTFGETNFDEHYPGATWELFAAIARYLSPEDAPASNRAK